MTETGRPEPLPENQHFAFIGSLVLGLGFTISPEEASTYLREDPRRAEVLQPYITGADLNRRTDGSGSRWIINFHDWPLDRAANAFPELLQQVRERVKPERDRLPDYKKRMREAWWRYEHQAPTLYAAVRHRGSALGMARVGNTLMPMRVSTNAVFSDKVIVFATDDAADLAILSSSAHLAWTTRYTYTLRTDLSYSPSDVFMTWPRPLGNDTLRTLGTQLHEERAALMRTRALGLTKLYNEVHEPTVTDPAIIRLRKIHAQIDHAVLAAYGWADLDLQIGHHPTKIGIRWTVSPHARFELLDRLLVENHRRAELQR